MIILHRLLENEVPASAYWLLSARANQLLGMDSEDPLFASHVEHYDDVGDIAVRVRTDLSGLRVAMDPLQAANQRTLWQRLRTMWSKV